MAEFFLDNFVDTDNTGLESHTSDSGHGYVADEQGSANGAEILNNRLISGVAGQTWARVTGITSPETTFEYDFTLEHFTTFSAVRAGVVVLNGTDWEDSLWAYWSGAGQWLATTWLNVLDTQADTLSAGTHLMRARVSPGRIQLFELDGMGGETLLVDSDNGSAPDIPAMSTTLGIFVAGTMSASTGTHIEVASGNVAAVELAATAPMTFGATASLRVGKPLSATAAAEMGATARLEATKLLSATAGMAVGATANLRVTKQLSASAAMEMAAQAGIDVEKPLAATAAIAFGANANLETAVVVHLAATAPVEFDATASLHVEKRLAATADLEFGAVAQLNVQKLLAALAAMELDAFAQLESGAQGYVLVDSIRLALAVGVTGIRISPGVSLVDGRLAPAVGVDQLNLEQD